MPSIHDRILAINAECSTRFVDAESERLRYWAKHPTFFASVKCMDGHVLFPSITQTPVGIVKPFSAIGGKFNIWWPSFLGRMRHWVDKAVAKGCKSFIFVTYHFSASDPHLGCAGWKYDTAAARAHAERLQKELSFVFGEQLTAVVVGIETDRDMMIVHGPQGDISGRDVIGKNDEEIRLLVVRVFPNMDPRMIADLIPFLSGNAKRVDTLTHQPRAGQEKSHNERIIAVGQGFDWLAAANLALIINDADPNLAESIRVAASLIEKNLLHAAVGDDATVFTCIPYREPGVDRRQAVARARGLLAFAEKVIEDSTPALKKSSRLHGLAAIIWEPSKKIEVVSE